MGGKARIAKRLAEVMLSTTTDRVGYLEPFVGGAWVLEQMAPHFSAPAAGDVMLDVALLWQAVQQGWVPPTEISRERYDELRNAEPSAERAFAGFGCSFGGKWFGGYAKNDPSHAADYAGAAHRSIIKKTPVAQRSFITHADYRSWAPGPGVVVYCDPPYSGAPAWDADQFWATARQWTADGATVFISEYSAPADARVVWSADVLQALNGARSGTQGTVAEKLFRL